MGDITKANELSMEGRMFKGNLKVKLKDIQSLFDPGEELVIKRTRIDHEKLPKPWEWITK